MDIRNKKINFLGDSITEGHGCSSPEKCFASLIARDHGAVCRNYGIGGTRIARQKQPSENPKHDLDFVGRYDKMDPDADIVAVFGGTNDFGHGDAPMGTMADRTRDSFYGALHLLYTGLITMYPDARIIVDGGARHAACDAARGTQARALTVDETADKFRAISGLDEPEPLIAAIMDEDLPLSTVIDLLG